MYRSTRQSVMKYKYFYTDYATNKEIPGEAPKVADRSRVMRSMKRVLQRPDNFLGILNDRNQCLQFMVNADRSVLIDIPIIGDGAFCGSKSKMATLSKCLALVESLNGDEDFQDLLPDEAFIAEAAVQEGFKKPWWKFWGK